MCVFVLYANVTLNLVRCVGFFYCSVALVFFSSHTTQPYHMVLCVCYRFGIVGAVRIYVKRILKKNKREIYTPRAIHSFYFNSFMAFFVVQFVGMSIKRRMSSIRQKIPRNSNVSLVNHIVHLDSSFSKYISIQSGF